MDGFSLRLLTDPDMLACNQNGVMGQLLHEHDGVETWHTPHRADEAKGWLGIFNRSDLTRTVVLSRASLGLPSTGEFLITSVWEGNKPYVFSGDESYTKEVRPNGVLFLRYTSP